MSCRFSEVVSYNSVNGSGGSIFSTECMVFITWDFYGSQIGFWFSIHSCIIILPKNIVVLGSYLTLGYGSFVKFHKISRYALGCSPDLGQVPLLAGLGSSLTRLKYVRLSVCKVLVRYISCILLRSSHFILRKKHIFLGAQGNVLGLTDHYSQLFKP